MILGRQLAGRLATVADQIADTFGRLAALHEEAANTRGHPRSVDARKRALLERRVERQERDAAEWFRSIASGG
jgi:hypothetical protein